LYPGVVASQVKVSFQKGEDIDVRRESKHDIVEKMRGQYYKGGRQEKGRIIEEVMTLTGYDRAYTQRLLRRGAMSARPRVR